MRALLLALAATLVSSAASASPIFSPDPALQAKAAGYQRQETTFATRENGLFLDVFVNPADVDTVKAYFAQTAEPDFQKQSGKHPYAVVQEFGEYGDEGNFAGVASVGIGARLLALRASGAPEADVAVARNAAIRAAKAWHVYATIGGPGVIARGIRKLTPEGTDPTPPGGAPEIVPLKDASGKALPESKKAVWRAPVAAGLSDWVWMDDTSKDQVSGYMLGALWLWEALKDDPAAPQDVLTQLGQDATVFVKALMQVAPEYGIDLCIRDADGRLTAAHDLNDRQITPDSVIPETITLRNGFNAAMALGIVRAAYHMGGDPDVGKYYYEELVGKRNYPKLMTQTAGFIFLGAPTNFSNVNMLTISLALIGRTETDPYVRDMLDQALTKGFWSTGDSRDVSHTKQPWFDAVYAAYAKAPEDVSARLAEGLAGFQGAPSFERDRVNCDDTEIAAGKCLAIDGVTTIELEADKGHGGSAVSKHILPWSIRPDSDFVWRSDPFGVNGTGSTMLDSGGDFLAAYWFPQANDKDTTKNVSPHARPALPYTFVDPDGDDGDTDAGADPGSSGGGKSGCRTAPSDPGAGLALFGIGFAIALGLRSRRKG